MKLKLFVVAHSLVFLSGVAAQDLTPLEEFLPRAPQIADPASAVPTAQERSVQLDAIQRQLGAPPDLGSGVDWESLISRQLENTSGGGASDGQLDLVLRERLSEGLSEMFSQRATLDAFAAPVAEAEFLAMVPDVADDDPAWTAIFDDLNEAHLLGNMSATAMVGESLLLGRGTEVDQQAGVALLTQAMGAGVPAAFTASGEFLLRQGEVGSDAQRLGLQLLEQGYELGDGNAALTLADYNMGAGRTDVAREQYLVAAQYGDAEAQVRSRAGLQAFCEDPDYDCSPQQIAVAVSRVPVMQGEVLVDFSDRWPDRYAPVFTAAQVVFPFRKEGAPPLARFWFFEERTPTIDRDLGVSYAPLMERDGLLAAIQGVLDTDPSERLLLYVHGFNNSIRDALLGVARLKSEGMLPGIPMVYSWAAGKEQVRLHPQSYLPYVGYSHDIQIAASSCDQFRSFLIGLTDQIAAERIILFGHSHGAKLIHSALTDCEFLRPPAPTFNGRFGNVIYVAPDIDRDQFLQSYTQLQEVAEQVAFYASDKDMALQTSGNFVRGGLPRLGVGGADLVVVDGVSAIDASELPGVGDTGFGHEYAFLNPAVLADIRAILNGREPDCRVLREGNVPSWKLRTDC